MNESIIQILTPTHFDNLLRKLPRFEFNRICFEESLSQQLPQPHRRLFL